MDVIVETSKGSEFTIEIWFFATVLEMKQAIEKHQGIPVDSQSLSFNGHVMADEGDTELYGVLEGSRIKVDVNETEPENAAVKAKSVKVKVMVLPMGSAKKIAVEVNPSDNVSELRKELERIQGQLRNFHLPTEGYFFIHKQKVMNEGRSFRWHDVRHGDTIDVFNGKVVDGS